MPSSPRAAGLTAAQAERDGHRTRVVDYDLGSVSGAAPHADGYTGRARMVVDEDRQVLLGMAFAGPAVPVFPPISEVWLRLLEGYGGPGS